MDNFDNKTKMMLLADMLEASNGTDPYGEGSFMPENDEELIKQRLLEQQQQAQMAQDPFAEGYDVDFSRNYLTDPTYRR